KSSWHSNRASADREYGSGRGGSAQSDIGAKANHFPERGEREGPDRAVGIPSPTRRKGPSVSVDAPVARQRHQSGFGGQGVRIRQAAEQRSSADRPKGPAGGRDHHAIRYYWQCQIR